MKKLIILLWIIVGCLVTTNCAMSPDLYSNRNNLSWHEYLEFNNFDDLLIYPFESKYEFTYNYYLNKKMLDKYGLTMGNGGTDITTCNPFEYIPFPNIIDDENQNNDLKKKAFLSGSDSSIRIGMWRMENQNIVPLIYNQTDKLKNNSNMLKDYYRAKATLLESMIVAGTIKINYQRIRFSLFIPQYSYIKDIVINDDDIMEIKKEINERKGRQEYQLKIYLVREEGKYLINQMVFSITSQHFSSQGQYENSLEIQKYITYLDEYADSFFTDKEIITITNSKIYNCDFDIGNHNTGFYISR